MKTGDPTQVGSRRGPHHEVIRAAQENALRDLGAARDHSFELGARARTLIFRP